MDVANSGPLASYPLGSIAISNNNGFCKKDSFYYGYFFDNNNLTLNSYSTYNIHCDAFRLRLDSMQETSCDATVKLPPYKFSYFSELVPRNLSFGMDHWGFSNGITTNSTLVPTYIIGDATRVSSIVQGANRDPAWPAMRGGSLQQITYPTGGLSKFVFEPNDTYVNYNTYTKTVRTNISVGYDGSTQNTGTFTTSSASNTWEVDMTSNSSTGNDNLEFSCGGGANITGATSTTSYINPSPNTTCNMTFYGSGNTTGYGATATIYELVPTPISGNVMVGGLRVKTITNNDGLTTNNVVTSYVYTNGGQPGGQTSGILYSRPAYVQNIRNDIYGYVYGPFCSPIGCISCGGGAGYFISPSSITPMSTFQGNHIGYNEVHVSQSNNGSSVYRYYGSPSWDNVISDVCVRTINTGPCTLSSPNFPAPPPPFEYQRGQLKYEGHYNQNGQILKDVTYTYNYLPDPLLTPGIKFITVTGLYSYTMYSLQSAKKTGSTSVSSLYDPVNGTYASTTSTVYYGSNYHHQPTRSVVTTSTNDSLVTNIKYPFDFRIASCDAIPDSLPYYTNSVNGYYSQMNSNIGSCSIDAGWECRYDTFQNYRRNINLARINFINYRRRSYSDSANLLNTCYNNALSTADTLLKPILKLQNEYYNVPVESSEWKNQNLLHASYTRFDTSTSPVGYVYPGRTKLINLQASSAIFTNASISGNTISKDSRYADESFYNFDRGNPVQVTARDGIASSYIWDYQNTEPVAKVSNAPASQVAYTSFEADGKGNWTFSGSPVSDPTAPTGSKCYLLTNGPISKSGLPSLKYIVSFWQKAGGTVNVTGGTNAFIAGKSINGWYYYEYTVTGATSITLSGTGTIDELRLYPSDAQMVTYTYTPLLGMTSECDADNKITYYSYDALGRLKWIKDQDSNIIKTMQYHYQGETN
jgi:YD repeat-containing protein